jgi:hypothetical protein
MRHYFNYSGALRAPLYSSITDELRDTVERFALGVLLCRCRRPFDFLLAVIDAASSHVQHNAGV